MAGQSASPRVVCPGWAGAHTEERVLSEGSEPVSHGMCADCERAWQDRYGLPERNRATVLDHEGSDVPKPGAGAAALDALSELVIAVAEVTAIFDDFENMTDAADILPGATAAMQRLRAEGVKAALLLPITPDLRIALGVDLASGPER